MAFGRRAALLLTALVVGVGVVVAVIVLHRGKAKEGPAFAAWVGVLRQRRTPLPANLRLAGFSPTETRFALIRAGRRYFVAPGSGQGSDNVCLIEMDGPSSGSSTCSTPPSRGQAETVFASTASHGTIAQLAGIAADGFERASINGVSTPIVNNVFAFDHVRAADHFTVHGLIARRFHFPRNRAARRSRETRSRQAGGQRANVNRTRLTR